MFSERLLVCDDVVSAGTADRHSGLPQAGGLLQSPGLRHLWVRSPVFGLVSIVAYVESKIKYFESQLSEERFLGELSAELRETDSRVAIKTATYHLTYILHININFYLCSFVLTNMTPI